MSMPEAIKQTDINEWIIKELSSLLHFPVTKDMAKCILMIESSRDLEDYMSTLLDLTNPQHQKFLKELIQRKSFSDTRAYKKTQLEDYVEPMEKKEKKKIKGKGEPKKTEDTGGKKKTKYVNLYGANDVVLLKGRHICNCQASKHKLINNCLRCGRIVCEQEGTGPCLYCSTPVYSREELHKNPELSKSIQGDSSALSSALQLKQKLLEYDKASEVRTRVIDDENDYFSTNSVWLSKEMKEKLAEKERELEELKHSRRRDLILDFTGRCLIDDEFKRLNLENSILDEVTAMMDNNSSLLHCSPQSDDHFDFPLVFEESKAFMSPVSKPGEWHNRIGRVQDKQVMEMTDTGLCLSIHQPWASLIIQGFRSAEGRSWYTSHRGRLWIASTGKVPSDEEVQEARTTYAVITGEEVVLPRKLPTGCLLGCVNLVDCLPQEEYRASYPEGELLDPYVFIFSDPIKSPVLFPMKGKHKIYKLEKNIHEAATKCLEKLAKT